MPAASPSALDRLAVSLATGLGLGYVPRAPGTAGSLGAVALFVLLERLFGNPPPTLLYVAVLVILMVVGSWSTARALPHWNRSDPQQIVVDEILGQWVTYAALVLAPLVLVSDVRAPAGWKYLLAGFILFRAFDVMKPFPIRRSERLPGAAGVLTDDVLAGAYAGAVLFLLFRLGWLT